MANLKKILNIIKITIKNIAKFFYNLTIDNTRLIDIARKKGVKIGENCRLYSNNFGSEPYLIEIGNHVTVTNGVQFITHDGGVWVFREDKLPNADLLGKIKIEDNCFIGTNAIILPSVTIGENSIVAAGSVVTKSIPKNSVVAGVPARVIKNTDEYYEGIKDRVINTKQLDSASKKTTILEKLNEF
ncbi:MAG: acyltransferase [Paraclostridium sordellii]